MALVVEDGTGLPDANAYASLAYVDAYFTLRGNETWTFASEDERTVAIIQATDYIDNRWGSLLASVRTTEEQALEFPRKKWEGMPDTLLKATSEYALRALISPLAPDPEYDESGRTVSETKEKVGPIEEQKKYLDTGNGIEWRAYPSADARMRPLLNVAATGSRVIRNG